jgi:hypothetical protein
VLDIPGPMTGSSGECSACPLLLDVLSELYKPPCFLIDLGLHLVDLLELCVLTPIGTGTTASSRGCQREMRHAEVVAFVVISLIDVETFATRAITLVVKVVAIVRAPGEAVVTCGHEVPHGTGITKAREIPTEVGVILFLGTRWSRG